MDYWHNVLHVCAGVKMNCCTAHPTIFMTIHVSRYFGRYKAYIHSLYHCILINLATFAPMFPTDLQWLHHDNNAFLMQKDCIDGYIGGIQPDGSNLVEDWVKKNNVQTVFLFSFTYVIV